MVFSRAVRVASHVERSLDRFDRHWVNVLVAIRFEQPFRVGPVCLVASHVRPHVVRREKPHDVAKRLKLAGPIVSRSTRLKEDRRRRPLRERLEESIAREPSFFIDTAGPMRHGHLKD